MKIIFALTKQNNGPHLKPPSNNGNHYYDKTNYVCFVCGNPGHGARTFLSKNMALLHKLMLPKSHL